MTDLQLAILIRQYHRHLLDEIEKLEAQLPDEMRVEREVRNFLVKPGVSKFRVPCNRRLARASQ